MMRFPQGTRPILLRFTHRPSKPPCRPHLSGQISFCPNEEHTSWMNTGWTPQTRAQLVWVARLTMVYSGYMVDTFILLHSLWMFMEVFLGRPTDLQSFLGRCQSTLMQPIHLHIAKHGLGCAPHSEQRPTKTFVVKNLLFCLNRLEMH